MSLAKKFKTDTNKANEGVWFEYADAPNEDGSIPAFKLARKTSQNKKYGKAMRDLTQDFVNDDGTFDIASLSEEDAEKKELEIFLSSVLMDWRNFYPNEDDKFALPFSTDEARKVFSNPDWTDLYKDLSKKAGAASAFRNKKREEEVKN